MTAWRAGGFAQPEACSYRPPVNKRALSTGFVSKIHTERDPSVVALPETLEIRPLKRPVDATIRVPGSKSMTNRALVLAALSSARSPCLVRGALQSEDTELMVGALRELGFVIRPEWEQQPPGINVQRGDEHGGYGSGGDEIAPIPRNRGDLFLGNSGTCMRFLTALVSLGRGRYRLDGVARMRQRPMEDLLIALRELGAGALSEKANGCPPVVVEAHGLSGGTAHLSGNVSSQFVSALLMAVPLARGEVTIVLEGTLVSEPYVEMTIRMVELAGVSIERRADRVFSIAGRQAYRAASFEIEPDASAASYFFAAAAITGGKIDVPGLFRRSLQGDVRFVHVLEEMGCRVVEDDCGLGVEGGPLRGIEADMNDISDCVMTLAAVACFAEGTTTIRNVAHIRHKETDRLLALGKELRRIGVNVKELPDGLAITPGAMRGALLQTYNDHRMAMALSLIGLRLSGIIIDNPGCVAKTYPDFYSDFNRLYGVA
jgi:3-phosphoshikimate 1-carboxyvinyltransferase